MTIYHRGEWHYDLNIWPREGKFIWHVVCLKVDRTRDIQNVFGTLVATGIATSREEAEREGVAAIDDHSKQSA